MFLSEKEQAILNTFPYPIAIDIIKHDISPWHPNLEIELIILRLFPFIVACDIINVLRLQIMEDYKEKWNNVHQNLNRIIHNIGNNANLWADYVYLDTHERRTFAQQPHEYLINQLNFNNNQPNFGRQVTATIPRNGDLLNNMYFQVRLDFNHIYREPPLQENYFNLVQPFQHHTNIPDNPGINVYAFALNPDNPNPEDTDRVWTMDDLDEFVNGQITYLDHGAAASS